MTDLPAGWIEVALGEVSEVRLGRQRSPKHHSGTQMRPYVRAANVGWDGLRLEDVKSMNFTDKEMDVYELRGGDLLLNEASGSALEVGKPAIWNNEIERCAFQNTLLRVRAMGPDPRYLLHLFRHSAESGRFASLSRGVGIFHLGRKALAEMPIPLPPLEEQRRIAAILDKADDLRTKRRTAVEQLDSLTQAIFVDMFGTENAATRSEEREVGELCDVKGGKRIPKGFDYCADPTEWRYLRVRDMTSGFVEAATMPFLPAEVARKLDRYRVREGDVVISIAGTIGRVAEVDADADGAFLTENAARLAPRGESEYVPTYLAHALRTPRAQRSIAERTGQVTIGKLALFRIAELRVAVPPLDEQHRFEQRLRSLSEARRLAARSLSVLESLFASLQSRAFRGEL